MVTPSCPRAIRPGRLPQPLADRPIGAAGLGHEQATTTLNRDTDTPLTSHARVRAVAGMHPHKSAAWRRPIASRA
jgi:hypothetical protein